MSNQKNFLLERAKLRDQRGKIGLFDNQCGCCRRHCSNEDPDRHTAKQTELSNVQQSEEAIVIRDSRDVNVTSTDTQAAVNVQVAIQTAIALVISLSIGNDEKTEVVTTDLLGKLKSSQAHKQQICIENSSDVNVTAIDTAISVNTQVLLQTLIAIVASLDIG